MLVDKDNQTQGGSHLNRYVITIEYEGKEDEWVVVVAPQSSGLVKVKFFESKREIPFVSEEGIASEDLEFAHALRQGEQAIYWLEKLPKDELSEIKKVTAKVYSDVSNILIKMESDP